jgi:hypothetical protein
MRSFRALMQKNREALSAVLDYIFGSRLPSATRERWLANDLDALRAM